MVRRGRVLLNIIAASLLFFNSAHGLDKKDQKIIDLTNLINEQRAEINKLKKQIEELTGKGNEQGSASKNKDSESDRFGPKKPPVPPGDSSLCLQPVRLIPESFEASKSYAGHPPRESMDENLKSKWSTGGGVPAIGQHLKLSFREPKTLMKIEIYNPEKESFRLKEATLIFSDGSEQSAISEGLDGWDKFDIKPVKTKSIIIKAKKVYPMEINYMRIYELSLIGCES